MRHHLLLALSLSAAFLSAQETRERAPQIPFKLVEDFFKVPDNIYFAEAVGVALNSKGHIFIANRGNHPLLEFNPDGTFIRSWGEESEIFHAPHSVRFDAQDNMWFVDAGNNLIVKFDQDRQILQVLGSRPEPWTWDTHVIEKAVPGPTHFYQPTDTVVGPDGSVYITDGYGNSRVAKFSRDGQLLKYWGQRGTGPSQFNTPHSIVMDRNSTLYVADRQNNRIQLFDTEGNFKKEWRLSGPPWSLCITPGPAQIIYAGSIGRIFKLDLTGKVLGEFGKPGKLAGEVDSVHAIACPDEKTVYAAQEFSYRFDKFLLQ
jgi:DNA-binding beta-propeller fold protein YncE